MQAPAAHVLFEDAVLFPQIGNHLKLAAIHPPGEGDEQNLPSDRVEHPPSLPATAALTIRARLNFRIVRAFFSAGCEGCHADVPRAVAPN
jgi:hypothetical protein